MSSERIPIPQNSAADKLNLGLYYLDYLEYSDYLGTGVFYSYNNNYWRLNMRKLIVLTFVLASAVAHADIIRCTFTEPWIDSTYSMNKSTLTYESPDPHFKKVVKNVSFQIKSAGVFELVDKNGKLLQVLKLNHQGSDGMSDAVYPFEVLDKTQTTMANNGVGGCRSNHLNFVVLAN
jgi:hypothetical protein